MTDTSRFGGLRIYILPLAGSKVVSKGAYNNNKTRVFSKAHVFHTAFESFTATGCGDWLLASVIIKPAYDNFHESKSYSVAGLSEMQNCC